MQLPQYAWSAVLTAEKISLKHLYNLEMTISSSLGMVSIYNYLIHVQSVQQQLPVNLWEFLCKVLINR